MGPTWRQLILKPRKRQKNTFSILSLGGAPNRGGGVAKVVIMTPRKPNSAKRKVVKVKLTNMYRVYATITGLGHDLHEFSLVMVRGGSAKDLPGVNLALIRGKYGFDMPERIIRMQRRSKFGILKRRTKVSFKIAPWRPGGHKKDK